MVKPHVNRSTGDRAMQHYRSTGSVHTDRPDRSTGQPIIRSTALVDRFPCDPVDRWNQLRERNSRKSVQNLQIQSQIEIFQRKTTRSGF
ncbi:hypothetical protein L484_012339 [Morus notabilis]|uniref:Uncharacterized protein n=1 Tax=Morus notabilis TaxID=981085 RepID=W9RQQ3_9ROSA|nr:hypothetical protein L484_012339 [Morus notabilis]